ncbi:hypothetical protein CFIMG_008370RA00001 [Ceratocystis fimbriata CBS 114723]|uniref:Uncharacterized protein n=1 Tax=Ceratocystis fimbriata CBS 114723 TaxID=1035309 RepID=A0A2C5X379_9PEZI|nr:hypothetical protein CFIMG_008370RA00001 [Ceratocystis fimbriata CBS 114723]
MVAEPDPNLEEPFCLLETWAGYILLRLFRVFIETALFFSRMIETLMQFAVFRVFSRIMWFLVLTPAFTTFRVVAGITIIEMSFLVYLMSFEWQAMSGTAGHRVGFWEGLTVSEPSEVKRPGRHLQ